ncbi:dermonecrotic toxin domain-containing protein [Pseudomonas fluorescens]|uniref:Dermonecrotic toxin N-terminal domain-containing protein n=1 Tax=Pseudomonas fluorescens TaxID=294 RepID=A0A5E7BDE6_PSEFL|nr:DUF6543 domain-containing protein [Pseudomonas fluorescens]VVN89435.1 hypothetical protein PS691_01744 [Pseudomonas fluorescens]
MDNNVLLPSDPPVAGRLDLSTSRPASAPEPTAASRTAAGLAAFLEAGSQPDLALNRLEAAISSARLASNALRALLTRMPGLRSVVHGQLAGAWGVDPDQLLLTFREPPDARPVVYTLTQVAANSLRAGLVASGFDTRVTGPAINQAFRLTAQELLTEVAAVDLAGALKKALNLYWKGLADGSALSREAQAGQLRAELFRAQADLAHGIGELSAEGLSMVQAVFDAPTPDQRRDAGAELARLEVFELCLKGLDQTPVPFSGCLLISQPGRQVLFMPGLEQPFVDTLNRSALEDRVRALLNSPQRHLLWQMLPLERRRQLLFGFSTEQRLLPFVLDHRPVTGHALNHSMIQSIRTQARNEFKSAWEDNLLLLFMEPEPALSKQGGLQITDRLQGYRAGIATASVSRAISLAIGQQIALGIERADDDLSFGSLAPELAVAMRRKKIERHERNVLVLLEEYGSEKDTSPFSQCLKRQAALQANRLNAQQVLEGLGENLTSPAFWTQRLEQTGRDRQEEIAFWRTAALYEEADFQLVEGQLDEVDVARLGTVLHASAELDPQQSETQVLSISIGPHDGGYELAGALVVTSWSAMRNPDAAHSSLLYLPGTNGGLEKFHSLAALKLRLGCALRGQYGAYLWSYISVADQQAVSDLLNILPVATPAPLSLAAIKGPAMEHGVRRQLASYRRSLLEVAADPLALAEVGQALERNLRVPEHAARDQAFDNIAMARLSLSVIEKEHEWLLKVAPKVHEEYVALLAQYAQSSNILAVKLQTMPTLLDFARDRLKEQLEKDGLADLDIEAPLLDIPDHASATLISGRFTDKILLYLGLREDILVSKTRQDYSLLQLALENIDRQSLNSLRMGQVRVLDKRWEAQLNGHYLVTTISGLDVLGQYEKLIFQTCYGKPGPATTQTESVAAQLMTRPYRQRAELELLLARLKGLSPAAIGLFETALAAREASDLQKNNFDIELRAPVLAHVGAWIHQTYLNAIVLIHDKVTGKTLLYISTFDSGQCLIEHDRLQAAEDYLMSLIRDPVRFKPWAKKIDPDIDFNALQKVIDSTVNHHPQRWLTSVRLELCELVLILAHFYVYRLLDRAGLLGRSKTDLDALRQQEDSTRNWGYIRMGLALVPVAQTGVSFHELFQAIGRLYRGGSQEQILENVETVVLSSLEILISLIPVSWGAAKVGALKTSLSSLKRQQLLKTNGRAALRQATRGKKHYVMTSFDGYESGISLDGAVALTGPVDQGSYMKNGVQLIPRNGRTHEVYRGAGVLVLKKTAKRQVERAVKLDEFAEWQFQAAHGLAGGSGRGPRKRPGSPQPGPSRGNTPASRGPVVRTTEGGSPVSKPLDQALVEAIFEQQLRVEPLPADWRLKEFDQLIRNPGPIETYTVTGRYRQFQAIKIGPFHYEVLLTSDPSLVFVKSPGTLSAWDILDLHHWVDGPVSEQPLPAYFSSPGKKWFPLDPLLEQGKHLHEAIHRALPTLTQDTSKAIEAWLVARQDPSSGAITGNKLANYWQAQRSWNRGSAIEITPLNLLENLDAITVTGKHMSIRQLKPIPYGELEGIDFRLDAGRAARFTGTQWKGLPAQGKNARASTVVQEKLTELGFVHESLVGPSSSGASNALLARLPGSETIYCIVVRHARYTTMKLYGKDYLVLSNGWIERLLGMYPAKDHPLVGDLAVAYRNNKIIRMVAGVQPRKANGGTLHKVETQVPTDWVIFFRRLEFLSQVSA